MAALAVVVALVLLAALGPGGFMVGLATALIPVPAYIALALWLDRHEPEPRALLVRSFLWGMLVASLFSIVMNAAAVAYVQLTLGLSAIVGQRVGLLLASPIFEELSKGVALFLLFRRQRDEFDNVIDGAVYAAMVGLGFAATENILYYGNAALNDRLAIVFATRGVVSPFAHPLFTAMTGIGLGLARDTGNRRAAVLRVLAGLGAAITLHFLWNAAAAAHLLRLAYAFIMVPVFAAVLLLLRRSLARERALMIECIEAERVVTAMTVEDVDILCWRADAGGTQSNSLSRRERRDASQRLNRVRRAAIELAFACAHERERGDDDHRIVAKRDAYIRACNEWRDTRNRKVP